MERMAEYIGERFREPLTVAEIAAAVDLNANYAMTAFREGCGLSLWEYVTRLRISHAQRLLLTTDWTVERIALDCGFGAVSRFYAAFKRLCGVTPRQYRRQTETAR
jgi:AraC family transcriptional regulator, melibiose operon regulatory protein